MGRITRLCVLDRVLRAGALILLLACRPNVLSAQANSSSASLGTVAGYVDDSLHGVPFTGSVVTAVPLHSHRSRKSAVVDSLGAYQIEGLTAGSYRIEVNHPLLDSLDLTLVAPSVTVMPNTSTVVRLAIPSKVALVRGWCGDSLADEAVVTGIIRDDYGAPLHDAIIGMNWLDLESVTSLSAPRTIVARATSDARGRFVLCGVPTANSDVLAYLLIYGDAAHQLAIPYRATENGVLIQPIQLAALTSDTSSTHMTYVEQGTLAGRLVHSDGTNASRAQLFVMTAGARFWRAVTDSAGCFEMRGIPPGTYPLRARQLGYTAVDTLVSVHSGVQAISSLVLSPTPTQLETVHVVRSLDLSGFEHRRNVGAGYYVTANDIERSHASNISAVLRLSPAINVSDARGGPFITSTKPNPFTGAYVCATVFVDGRRMRPDEADMLPRSSEIAGMESYRPNEGPMEYGSRCALVLIWTRNYGATTKRR